MVAFAITPGPSAIRNAKKMTAAPGRVGAAVRRAMTRSAIDTKRNITGDIPKITGQASRNHGFDVKGGGGVTEIQWNVRYIAAFLEKGVGPHRIPKRKGYVSFNGVVRRSVDHPGHQAYNYVAKRIYKDANDWNREITKAVSRVLIA